MQDLWVDRHNDLNGCSKMKHDIIDTATHYIQANRNYKSMNILIKTVYVSSCTKHDNISKQNICVLIVRIATP